MDTEEPLPERLASVPIQEAQNQYLRPNEYSEIDGKHFLWGKEPRVSNPFQVLKNQILAELWSSPIS